MIRKIIAQDRADYLDMAKAFYCSEAVCHNIPEKHFADTFAEMMRGEVYAAGFIMAYENQTAGYALLARTFSQEAGGMVLWIEELYVKPEYRSCGLGHDFFTYLKSNLCENVKRIRLEVEDSNEKAISLYRRMGFTDLPYSQMINDL